MKSLLDGKKNSLTENQILDLFLIVDIILAGVLFGFCIFIAVIFIGYLMLAIQLIRRAYGFINLLKQLGEQKNV